MATEVNLEKLLEVGAHFGHQTKRWNPKMSEYIFGVREGITIFDLIKTKTAIDEALEFLSRAASSGKLVLFVGTKRQAKEKLRETAIALNAPFVDERWLGGTLTNFGQIRSSVKKLGEMKEARERGEYKEFTKKERLLIDRDIEKMEKKVGGLVSMDRVPDVIFIVDIHKERGAVREAQMSGVTTVGIADSNSDPSQVDLPVPMNDDASAALEYILDLVKEAMVAKQTAKPAKKAEPKAKKKSQKTPKKEKARKKTK